MTKTRRLALTERQRQQIREYKRANPLARQRAIAEWAESQFRRKISQSTINDCLHERYAYLDNKKFKAGDTGVARAVNALHPVLEEAIFEWHLRCEGMRVPVTGEMIVSAGKELWQKMPDFDNEPLQPKFSNGWLAGFKKRFKIKKYKQHGEAGAVDLAGAEEAIEQVRQVVKEYKACDIYNADETGLYWLKLPDTTLATGPQSGRKAKKDRITVLPTANADGTHKLDLWILGHAKNPRAFGTNLSRIRDLPFVWRANKTAWMTAVFFMEYLYWFDMQMGGRKVLLLLDNFSAHESAVEQLMAECAEQPLRNTRVQFLPANTTAVYQPMDQGIINSFKMQYRKVWLEHMVAATLDGRNPYENTTILNGVQWAIDAWRNKVTPTCIARCFRKSSIFGPRFGPDPRPDDWSELAYMEQLLGDLQREGQIRRAMDISNLINPPDEEVVDTSRDLLDHVAETFSRVESADADDMQEQQELPVVTTAEALKAMQLLIAYENQQEDPEQPLLEQLSKCQKAILGRRLVRNGLSAQRTLDMFLVDRTVDIS